MTTTDTSTRPASAADEGDGRSLGALGALGGIWLREVKRALRDRGQLIGGVSRPLLYILIMGIGLNPYFRAEVYGEVRFVVPYSYLQFIFAGVVVLNVMYTSVQSAVSVIWDREFGFLREVLVAPVPRFVVVLGKVLGGATVATLHGCIVLLFAYFADVELMAGSVIAAIGLIFLLSFCLTSLGIAIAHQVRSFEGFGVFSNAVILPLFFTSSSVFPLDPSLSRTQLFVLYPEWLVTVIYANPLTYAVDALRGKLIGFNQFDPSAGPVILAVLTVVFFFFALRGFRRG